MKVNGLAMIPGAIAVAPVLVVVLCTTSPPTEMSATVRFWGSAWIAWWGLLALITHGLELALQARKRHTWRKILHPRLQRH